MASEVIEVRHAEADHRLDLLSEEFSGATRIAIISIPHGMTNGHWRYDQIVIIELPLDLVIDLCANR